MQMHVAVPQRSCWLAEFVLAGQGVEAQGDWGERLAAGIEDDVYGWPVRRLGRTVRAVQEAAQLLLTPSVLLPVLS